MTSAISHFKITTVAATVLFMSACGIDRGGIDEFSPPPTLDVIPSGVVAGKIDIVDSTMNSITINDVALDVASSAIIINGVPANVADLTAGMYASTVATSGTPLLSPDEVRVDFNAVAKLVSFEPFQTTLELLGQTVSLDNLQVNTPGFQVPPAGAQTLGITGYVTSQGIIDATSITGYPTDDPLLDNIGDNGAVTGFAQQVDSVNSTFAIGLQSYDYSQAANITTNDGMVGELSRIRIQLSSGEVNGNLIVSSVQAAPLIDASIATNATINLSGYVTSIIDDSHFTVSFAAASIDNTTSFVNSTRTDLAIDRLINIQGTLQANGSVLVRTLTFLN